MLYNREGTDVVCSLLEVIFVYQPTAKERLALVTIDLHDFIGKLPVSRFAHGVLCEHEIETIEDFVALNWSEMNKIGRACLVDYVKIDVFWRYLHGGEVFADLHG